MLVFVCVVTRRGWYVGAVFFYQQRQVQLLWGKPVQIKSKLTQRLRPWVNLIEILKKKCDVFRCENRCLFMNILSAKSSVTPRVISVRPKILLLQSLVLLISPRLR